jgi:hypothetical protein
LFWKRIIMDGGCVSIIPISTCTAQKILSRSHASNKSLTSQLAASCSLSLIATWATIRLPSRKKTRSRHYSSPGLEHTHTRLCPSGWRTQELHISEPSSYASPISYTPMLKPTWMTWSLKP